MNTAILIDREEASKILNVSTRTVDRYLRKYRFKTKKDGRTVLIKREDVDKVIKEQIGHFVDLNIAQPHGQSAEKKASNITVTDIKVEKIKEPKGVEETVYKDLYLETKKELKERQDRLEAATYRVGQLESEVKNMVPLLEYSRKEKELKQAQAAIEEKAREGELKLVKAQQEVRAERIAKWIYLTLVGLLLIAEPILFLFWAFA
jgi:excisionase family DNA binding protein